MGNQIRSFAALCAEQMASSWYSFLIVICFFSNILFNSLGFIFCSIQQFVLYEKYFKSRGFNCCSVPLIIYYSSRKPHETKWSVYPANSCDFIFFFYRGIDAKVILNFFNVISSNHLFFVSKIEYKSADQSGWSFLWWFELFELNSRPNVWCKRGKTSKTILWFFFIYLFFFIVSCQRTTPT